MKKLTLTLALLGAVTIGAQAQTQLVQWTFEKGTTTQDYGAADANAVDTIITGTDFTSSFTSGVSSPVGNGSSHSYSATPWTANTSYYQITLSGDAGFLVTDSASALSLSYDQVSSGTGPTSFELEYDINDPTGSGTFLTLADSYSVGTSSWSSGSSKVAGHTFDLSSIDFTDVSSINFRILTLASSTGTDRVDNVTLSEVAAAPEPSTWALMAAGAALLIGFAIRRRTAATAKM